MPWAGLTPAGHRVRVIGAFAPRARFVFAPFPPGRGTWPPSDKAAGLRRAMSARDYSATSPSHRTSSITSIRRHKTSAGQGRFEHGSSGECDGSALARRDHRDGVLRELALLPIRIRSVWPRKGIASEGRGDGVACFPVHYSLSHFLIACSIRGRCAYTSPSDSLLENPECSMSCAR